MQLNLQDVDLPIRLHTERPLTDEQLMRFSSANEVLRIERDSTGELVLMSPAGVGTSHRNTWIIVQLAQWAEQDGRGLTFDSNGGFTLSDGSMRSPDAAWVCWEQWNALAEHDREHFAPLCPTFIIELLSPSDRLPELQAKMAMWLKQGAALAWLIDPERKIVEIYRPGHTPEIVEGATAVLGEGPVAGLRLDLTRIWG